MENSDTCSLCGCTLCIPVKPLTTCECVQIVCQHCLEKYLEFDKSPMQLVGSYKCLAGCGVEFCKEADHSMIIPVAARIADNLDREYGDITCPWCNTYTGTRRSLRNVHMNTCSGRYATCTSCYHIVGPHHTVNCKGCDARIPLCSNKYHMLHQCTAYKCYACHKCVPDHEESKCFGCGTIIYGCKTDTGAGAYYSHYETCAHIIKVYDQNTCKYQYMSLDQYMTQLPVCKRCNFRVSNPATHDDYCITIIELKRLLGLVSPVYTQYTHALQHFQFVKKH